MCSWIGLRLRAADARFPRTGHIREQSWLRGSRATGGDRKAGRSRESTLPPASSAVKQSSRAKRISQHTEWIAGGRLDARQTVLRGGGCAIRARRRQGSDRRDGRVVVRPSQIAQTHLTYFERMHRYNDVSKDNYAIEANIAAFIPLSTLQ